MHIHSYKYIDTFVDIYRHTQTRIEKYRDMLTGVHRHTYRHIETCIQTYILTHLQTCTDMQTYIYRERDKHADTHMAIMYRRV